VEVIARHHACARRCASDWRRHGDDTELSRILSRCPDLRVPTTSRERLRLSGEREFALLPLAVPSRADIGDPNRLLANPAVALLVEWAYHPAGGI
jgi:predicted ATPase